LATNFPTYGANFDGRMRRTAVNCSPVIHTLNFIPNHLLHMTYEFNRLTVSPKLALSLQQCSHVTVRPWVPSALVYYSLCTLIPDNCTCGVHRYGNSCIKPCRFLYFHLDNVTWILKRYRFYSPVAFNLMSYRFCQPLNFTI
jgi:hypothetical protein